MDDFNLPGSNKSQLDDETKKIVVDIQLKNITKILGGEVKHYTYCDKTTTHEKIIIEYNHKQK
jgi:hypothetical protein